MQKFTIEDKILIEVFPHQSRPGLVVDDRDIRPYKGRVISIGNIMKNVIVGDSVYFRYHMGFSVPETNPELLVLSYENIELIERED